MEENPNYISPLVYLGLDERTKDKVKDRYIVGSRHDYDIIVKYFTRYYKLNKSNEPTVDLTKKSYDIVQVRKWIAYFTYRTGKYSFRMISENMGYKNLGHGISYLAHSLEDEIQVNKGLKKQYEIHLKNLKELFITFKLATI